MSSGGRLAFFLSGGLPAGGAPVWPAGSVERCEVKFSELDRLMGDEFGASYASLLRSTLSLPLGGGMTADEALAAGVDPKAVWEAVCEVQSVPPERRLGRDIPPKR